MSNSNVFCEREIVGALSHVSDTPPDMSATIGHDSGLNRHESAYSINVSIWVASVLVLGCTAATYFQAAII